MIEVPYTQDHNDNQERVNIHDATPCIICGRGVTPRGWRYSVRIYWGTHIVNEQEAQELVAKDGGAGDLGYHPIGAACLSAHPELKPYVKEETREHTRRT